jgi:hypothetical protein
MGFLYILWFAGVVAVFLVTLACGSCVAGIVLDNAGACAWRVCISVECRVGSLLPEGERRGCVSSVG